MSNNMKEQAAKIAVDTAVKNPMFLESFSKILFSRLVGTEDVSGEEENQRSNLSGSILNRDPEQGNYFSNLSGTPLNDNSIDCDEEEFEEIKTWYIYICIYIYFYMHNATPHRSLLFASGIKSFG